MFWTSFKGNSSIHRLQSHKPCLSYYKTTPVLGLNIIHVPLNSKSKMYYVWVSFLQIGQTSCIWYEFALVFLRPFVSLPDHVRSSLIEPECQWHRFFTIIKHHETVLWKPRYQYLRKRYLQTKRILRTLISINVYVHLTNWIVTFFGCEGWSWGERDSHQASHQASHPSSSQTKETSEREDKTLWRFHKLCFYPLIHLLMINFYIFNDI